MSDATINWPGKSGNQYTYWIYTIGTNFKNQPGNYVFAKEISPGRWIPIYIGQTGNLEERLPNHEKLPCIRKNGGTHVHVHLGSDREGDRKSEEADLIQNWDPPCNKE